MRILFFLKAYKNIDDILSSLKETGRINSSHAVIRCGFKDQKNYRKYSRVKGQKARILDINNIKKKAV